jgi:HK97 family phage major capsid protein
VGQAVTIDRSGLNGALPDHGPSPACGRDYRAMFGYARSERLDMGGFKDSAEFLASIESGRFDPRLIRASMGETVPSSGGFSVPAGVAAEWLDASLPDELVRNLCRVFPMTTETLPIPGWDGADMSSGQTHGGFAMTFLAEGSAGTPQTPKMRQILLSAKTGAIYCDASIELVQDGKNFSGNLETALRKSVGYGIDRYCLVGVGGGQPLGLLNSPCKIQIAAEAGQKTDTIIYANLKKAFARQLNPGNAVWLFNASAIPELLEQNIAIGTGGSFVPLLNESNGKFSIFGRPVYFHPSVPALGDADGGGFVDFNFYGLGLRSDMAIDMSDAPRWLQRERSFRILLRFDGQCTLDKAVSPEHGDSLSPVVTLGAI